MSLRALGSLLTRRLAQAESSLGIGIDKAPAAAGSAAGRPARSLHTLRDLAARDGAYGAAAASSAALAGFVALLYFNKDTNKPAAEVTGVEARKEVPPHVLQELHDEEDLEVDEEAMRARFEDWMKEYGRSYGSEEEKARRYEIFKRRRIDCDRRNKRNASKPNGARFGTTEFSDWTDEEFMSRRGGRCGVFGWEGFFPHRKAQRRE